MSQKKPSFRDISMHVGYGDLRCTIVAEGTSWSPDVASDMVTRMRTLWDDAMCTAYQYGVLDTDTDEDEDEDWVTPDSELVEPHVVYVMREDENG